MQEHLPMVQAKQELLALLQERRVVIVVGETGCGKTTQLPQILDEAGYAEDGMIVVTQPRRPAAIHVARQVAREYGEEVGGRVGYHVRFSTQQSPRTKILFVTDGMLRHYAGRDPGLEGLSVIIVDEVHTRSAFTDFTLAYLKAILANRPDLHLILASATMDPRVFVDFFDGAATLNVPGRQFPVTISYRPTRDRFPDRAVTAEVGRMEQSRKEGDVLVFLPGVAEIMNTAHRLNEQKLPVRTLPFYGGMSPNEQEAVFEPADNRKVILATNIAETSLTIPGVKHVIDAGQERRVDFDHERYLERLRLGLCSQAAATQRAGRAGRMEPGTCTRLYSQEAFQAMPAFDAPNILRCNLTSLALDAALLGSADLSTLDLPTRVPADRAAQAMALLERWNMLDPHGVLTERGKKACKLSSDPDIAHLLFTAAVEDALPEMTVIAAFLSVRDVFYRDDVARSAFPSIPAQFVDPGSDLLSLIRIFEAYTVQPGDPAAWCARYGLHAYVMAGVREIEAQLRFQLRDIGYGLPRRAGSRSNDLGVMRALVRAFPERLCRFEVDGHYRSANLNGIRIPSSSLLHEREPEWFVAASFFETSRLWAHEVTEVSPAVAREIAPPAPDEPQPNVPAMSDAPVASPNAPTAPAKRLRGRLHIERGGSERWVDLDLTLSPMLTGETEVLVIPRKTVAIAPWKVPAALFGFSPETRSGLERLGLGTLADLPRSRSEVEALALSVASQAEILGVLYDLSLIPKPPLAGDEEDVRSDPEPDAIGILELPIREAGLPRSLAMKLITRGVFRVKDLLRLTERSFQIHRGSGGTGLVSVFEDAEMNQIRNLLDRYGYQLREDEPEEMDILERVAPENPVPPEEARKILGDKDFQDFMAYRSELHPLSRIRIRNAVALRHRRLALTWARFSIPAMKNRRDPAVEIQDLEQEGMIGLLKAITMFIPLQGHRFSTYATAWILQGIKRFLSNAGWVRIPVHRFDIIMAVRETIRKFIIRESREPTVVELAAALDRDPAEVRGALDEGRTLWSAISLDYSYASSSEHGEAPEGGENANNLHDLMPDANADVERHLDRAELVLELQDALARAPLLDVERSILVKVFGLFGEDEHSAENVALDLGMSPERVFGRLARTLRTLRTRSLWERFRLFTKLPDFEQGQIQIKWQLAIAALAAFIRERASRPWTAASALAFLAERAGQTLDDLRDPGPLAKPFRAVAALILSYDLDVPDAAIAESLGADEEEVPELLRRARIRIRDLKRLDLIAGWADEPIAEHEPRADHETESAAKATSVFLDEAAAAELNKILDEYPWKNSRERKIFGLRFGIGQAEETHEAVAQDFGITRQRIQQITSKTLAELMAHALWPRVEPYLRDTLEYRGQGPGRPPLKEGAFMRRVLVAADKPPPAASTPTYVSPEPKDPALPAAPPAVPISIVGADAKHIKEILDRFPWDNPRERQFFELRYGIGSLQVSLEVIGAREGISRQRALQVLEAVQARLIDHAIWPELSAALAGALGAPVEPAPDSEPVAPERILAAIQRIYGVLLAELQNESRMQPLVTIRHEAMWLLRKLGRLSYPSIGKILNRDHTTVMHGYAKIEFARTIDPAAGASLALLAGSITNPPEPGDQKGDAS